MAKSHLCLSRTLKAGGAVGEKCFAKTDSVAVVDEICSPFLIKKGVPDNGGERGGDDAGAGDEDL